VEAAAAKELEDATSHEFGFKKDFHHRNRLHASTHISCSHSLSHCQDARELTPDD
jgi:hypothetical protein